MERAAGDAGDLASQQQITSATTSIVYSEAKKFTDEAYRTQFLKDHPIYEVLKDENGNPTGTRRLSDEEVLRLQPAADGKIHVANNGIFNDLDAAAKYAAQHSTAEGGPQYLIHFPEAEYMVSELMIAGYQAFLEGTFDLTNATQTTVDLMNRYGQDGLHFDGHSRGSLTTGNAMEVLSNQGVAGVLSNTSINFFGPAYNVSNASALLGYLQGSGYDGIVQYQNHMADPVGILIGRNPPTGGTLPGGESSVLWQMIRAATAQPITSHNCYGTAPGACANFWNAGLPQYK
ncbi:hypothetical protein ACQ858_07010 [Variovorax ureilyticus]|uniref:hypothetical protein n=1 Tax=Variovorax ureilyticus TaxID=1836198 RepID=UPI003D67569E